MTGRVAIILAAGEGKRMKSDLPKVLNPVGGRPMILHVIECARAAGLQRQIVVVGFGRDEVIETLSGTGVEFAVQDEQLSDAGESQAAAVEALCRGLTQLSGMHRLALALHYDLGLKYEEMAAFLQVPVGTVMSRLHRGRKLLQSRLLEFARRKGILATGPDVPSTEEQGP